MEISRQSLLLVLLQSGPRHGWGIRDDFRLLVGDDLDASNVYRGLQKMESDGLVTSRWQDSPEGPPRRTYRLTAKGRRRAVNARRELAETITRLSSFLDEASDQSDRRRAG